MTHQTQETKTTILYKFVLKDKGNISQMKRRKPDLGRKWILGSCGLSYLPAYARRYNVPEPRTPDLLLVPQNSTE